MDEAFRLEGAAKAVKIEQAIQKSLTEMRVVRSGPSERGAEERARL